MNLAVGTRLGPYEILGPLGAGGMGEVYRAKDTRLDRDVAIKVLPEEFFEDKERRERFEREAKALAAVNHPNIAAVYSFEEVSGRHLLVHELLEGGTLRLALSDGALPVRIALEIGEKIAQGLAAAHEKGIVHRDLKPENVFLTSDGNVKILDFGLARREAGALSPEDTKSPTLVKLTDPGVVFGTVAYMSPEQARGGAVDFRTDQFSFGVVLHEMLAGERPFDRLSQAETMAAIIREEPAPLGTKTPTVPAPARWIVERCLSKEPSERYASTRDLARDLATCRQHLSEAVSAPVAAEPAKPAWRSPAAQAVGVAAAIALAFAFGTFFGTRLLRPGSPSVHPVSVTLSFPADAAPDRANQNPLALSPDGSVLVYSGLNGGRRKLFIRSMEREEIREIPETEGAANPFFSPDGLWVGFFDFPEKKLKKVALAGGPPIPLCDAPSARGGSWGADGTIVFTPAPRSGLLRIPAAGGEPKAVTTPDTAKAWGYYHPQILPDGENVLFEIKYLDRASRAAVVSLRTGQQRIILEDAEYPRYLPTGHLVFARAGVLYAAPFGLERLQTTGAPVPLLQDVVTNRAGTGAVGFAWSQDGTLVYLPYRQLQRTLVWVDRKGAVEQAPFPPGGYLQVALSPDGGRLAAISYGKAENLSLLLGDLARSTLTRLTSEGIYSFLAWAPDGRRIAYSSRPEGRALWQVFWQSADGSSPPERLGVETPNQAEQPTSFSPDSSALLIQRADYSGASPASWQHYEAFVLPMTEEMKLRPFLQSKFSVASARFSPDGRWVAYTSNESGQYEIYVQPYPGPGPKWQISTDGGFDPRWSRSGRELFYRQGIKLMAVDVELKPTFRAGRPRALFEGPYLHEGIDVGTTYDVSPDGTRFLMINPDPAESGPAQVKVVLNWFEEVKRRVAGAK